MMTREHSAKILKKLASVYGSPAPDLQFHNHYELAVSVVLSAQTTDRQVNVVTPDLFKTYPDFTALAKARVRDVEKIIKSTGYYHAKARHIISLAGEVVGLHGGELPADFNKLLTLTGIGRKSASIIMSIAFNVPAIAVDTHVLRLSNRLGYIASDNPYQVEKALAAIVPQRDWGAINALFIQHGRKICKARCPLCGECPLSSLCASYGKIC